MQSLALKYRPQRFEDVVEQEDIIKIFKNQLKIGEIKNSYLLVGGAGTGKTTCGRILGKEINNGKGTIIEIDGASNNGVDQIREIIAQARIRAIDSEYKIFLIDECHMITIQGWNAFLKCLEEPPLKTIFIFCTTNPEKIPKTILSRVQRYDFKKISRQGILSNLAHICGEEEHIEIFDVAALEYITNLADGHMRDALTMLDKCVAYDNNITVDNVVKALGISSYDDLLVLLGSVVYCEEHNIIEVIEETYDKGIDLKQFIDDEIGLVLDYTKWKIMHNLNYCNCPAFIESQFNNLNVSSDVLLHYLNTLLEIKNTIKYDSSPKNVIESILILESEFIRNHQ